MYLCAVKQSRMNHDRTYRPFRCVSAPRLRDADGSVRSLPCRYARSAEIVLCWDEQNRLLGVLDEGRRLSCYQYDANGDRTYKFTGEYAVQNQSGQWYHFYQLDKGTLYASPYLVSNEKGYTKHYYAETERIASRIGGGGLQDLHKGFENYPDMVGKHKKSSAKLFYKVMECLDADALPQEDALKYLYEWLEFVEEENDCYWYHPDHLGSASWVTDADGSAVQHLEYLPWGEDFVDQRLNSFDGVRYTFSAKEKDTETGYSYFGSRYYNSDLSIWLSVDPMADKYPSMSPYVYCANNPVKLVDPNGEEVGNYYDLNGNYLGNDKIDDGKIYVVIETPTGNTSVNPRDQYDEKNIFQVPSFEKRKEIVDKLEDFDRQRPNAEWGGVCGVGINPNNDMYEVEKVVWGNPSQDGNPSNSERLGYRQLNMKEIGINGFCVFFDYHSHGSGGWIQKPSNWFDSEAGIWRGDIPNVTKRLQVSSGSRTFAVFAMEEKNVYFYTDKGVCGKMDFNTFRNLGQ